MEKDPTPTAPPAEPSQPSAPKSAPPPPFEPDLDLIGEMEREQNGEPKQR